MFGENCNVYNTQLTQLIHNASTENENPGDTYVSTIRLQKILGWGGGRMQEKDITQKGIILRIISWNNRLNSCAASFYTF